MLRICDLPAHHRPREKLAMYGAQALTDGELLALVLCSGTHKADVRTLAKRCLKLFDQPCGQLSLSQVCESTDLGPAKGAQIVALQEFIRRRGFAGETIRSAADAYHLIKRYGDRRRELLLCISLDGAQRCLGVDIVAIGGEKTCVAAPREIFSFAMTRQAAAIIVAHNHPSGVLRISSADRRATARIVRAAKILGLNLIDHLIISRSGFLSLHEEGLI